MPVKLQNTQHKNDVGCLMYIDISVTLELSDLSTLWGPYVVQVQLTVS